MDKKIIVTPDGVQELDLTAEEISQREVDIANDEAEATAKAKAEAQVQADKEAKETLKATAKAKLIAGEPLTEEEADTIVL
ncbi:translation initiation factor IF-2 [uncultured Mediterranean phage uvMED]|nr:translation initiation factor IF-2 [uncultured Mediterranean phage uvMED]